MKKSILIFVALFFSVLSFAANLSERIGIIGAGPSGLMAAYALKKKGYKNVVVLEQEGHVGGKVLTVDYEGHPYELGAVITAPDYDIILALAKELDIDLTPTPHSIACDTDGTMHSMISWTNDRYGWMRMPKICKDFATFSYYVVTHDRFFEPGFSATPQEMVATFEDFAMDNGMGAVLENYRPVMVGCGYGYAESMPAPYWMKLMKTFGHEYTKSIFNRDEFYRGFTTGWQSLWVKLVEDKNLDVRLNERVVSVDRTRGDRIQVATTNAVFNFDRLIVSVPHLAPNFMAMNAEEHNILSYVRTLPYKVTLVKIDGLPQKAHLWLRENSTRCDRDGNANDGKPVLLSSNQETNVYQIYQFTEGAKTSGALRDILVATVKDLGGDLKEIIREETFTYFPHFTVAAFEKNIPQKLEEIQGKGGVYFTGGLFNFETVELSAQHAQALVKNHF